MQLPKLSPEDDLRLTMIINLARSRPALLESSGYSEKLIQALGAPKPVAAAVVKREEISENDMIGEIEEMIRTSKEFLKDTTKLAISEKVQLHKAQAGLVEKWINNKEKVLNLKAMVEFQNVVIAFMDEVLTPDQRTDFVNRIRGLR